MVRVISLLWTLVLAILVTMLSFFYIQESIKHGFPFSFAQEAVAVDGTIAYNFNIWSIALDIIVWWLLFSLTWIIIRNYILQVD